MRVDRLVLLVGALLCSASAFATVTATPPAVSAKPGQNTGTVNVTLAYTPPSIPGTGNIAIGGLPAGVTTIPAAVTYNYMVASPAAATSFAFALGTLVTPGTYPITIQDATRDAGLTTMMLTVTPASFSMSITPNPVNLTAGGSPAPATVTTFPETGFSESITYTLTGLPPFILSDGPKQTTGPGYPAVPFSLSATNSASPGMYPGLLTAQSSGGQLKTAPFTVVVQQTDLGATFSSPSMSICNGAAAAANGIQLTPLNGYNGTPQLTFTSIPAGITITPVSPSANAMPPGQTVPFTVSASGATPGVKMATLNVSDPPAGINKSLLLTIVVGSGAFTANVIPSAVTLTPGGGPQSVSASAITTGCPIGNVAVTTSGAPAGLVVTPSAGAIAMPASAPIAFSLVASPAVVPGTYPITFTFTADGVVRTSVVQVSVAAPPDFALVVAPSTVTIATGATSATNISVTPVNGFTGLVNVSAPNSPGLTFTPTVFTLAAGASQPVTIAVAAGSTLGPRPFLFNATSGGVNRTAELRVNVVAPPPILTSATPPSLVVGATSTLIRVAGDFLQTGAQFVSSNPSLLVEGSTVLTTKLADVRVRVRGDATPGPRELTVVNPDGGRSAIPLLLVVYPTSSIAAPLEVVSAAIIFPARGTMIANGETLHPRGLLATSGTGTIIGSWRFDGVPFDRFIANAGAGMPVEVRANVPIPASYAGTHTLELVIESPRQVVSPAIEILSTIDRASRLMLLAPPDGAVIRERAPLFRWSLVPNCSGYVVEVALPAESKQPDPPSKILRFRVSDAEWQPTEDDLKAIGSGIHRWRVRPVCAGESELDPTDWRRFAVLPEVVNVSMLPVTTDLIRWKSDVAGLLHRVEFLARSGATIFSAFTPFSEYAVPRAFPSGTAVRVSAIAPGGVLLGTSASILAPRGSDSAIRFAGNVPVEIGNVFPLDGSTVGSTQPRITAEWKGAVAKERVTLYLDNLDLTPVSTITPASIAYDPLVAIEAGVHTLTLVVAEQRKQWTFTIAPEPDVGAVTPATGLRGDWVITPLGTVTLVRDVNDQARTQFSAQTDLANGTFTNKSTGDVSVRHDFERDSTVQESRNWLFDLGGKQGSVQEAVRVGFSQPDFLDQSQFLSTGLARGGAQAKVSMPLGIASYYQTFTAQPAGVSSASFGPDQRVRAAAFQIPTSARWDFRVLGITIDEDPALYTSGGKGDALGVFVRYSRGPAFRAIIEGARGKFAPEAGSFQSSVAGNAWRIGLDGVVGTATYALNVRKTDAGFVNPANRGFTAGGVPDRIGGELSLTKMFGLTTVSVQLRRAQDGTAPDVLLVPKTKQSGLSASVQRAFGQHVSLSVTGNATKDTGEALPDLFMPETNRASTGASATLSQFFGQYAFSQTITRQDFRDRVNELSNQTTSGVTLTAAGTFNPVFSLAGVLSGIRNEGSVVIGTTDLVTASLQPAINIARLFLSLQPRASYTKSKNDLLATETQSEQYQALLTFAPQWLDSVFALQVSADWSRTQFTGNTQPAPYVRRYVATISLHTRLGSTPPAQ